MGGGGQLMKRIPSIKFPQRHPKLSASGSPSAPQTSSKWGDAQKLTIPSGPTNTSVGGKASLQPKRTPVTDSEIEAILLGGCI